MTENSSATLIEHLDELRKHLWRWAVVWLVLATIFFILKENLFDLIFFAPLHNEFPFYVLFCRVLQVEGFCFEGILVKLVNISLPAQFLIHIKASAVLAFIASFPFLIFELWRFVRPGLYPHERRLGRRLILWISILFFFGTLFGYFALFPVSLVFLATYSISETIENMISVQSYISSLVNITLTAGLAFELPLFLYALGRIGLITKRTLKQYRAHALVVILFIAAVLTPPDVISQVLLGLPLYLLYELSILLVPEEEHKGNLKA